MAEIVKDFTDNDSFYEQVLYQRGRLVIDGELSEIGRLARMSRYRNEIIHQSEDASVSPSARHHGVPIMKRINFLNSTNAGVGDDQIKMSPQGTGISLISAWGYVWEFKADEFFDTTPNNTGSNSFQELYVVIEETEETAGTAPAIQVDNIGETARRVKLKITYKVGGLNVREAPNEHTAILPWDKDGKKSFLIGTIHRAQGGGPTTGNELQLHFRQPEEITRAEGLMMPGNFRIRSSSKKAFGSAATARISGPDEITITDMQVLIGLSYVANSVNSYLGVHIDGEFTLEIGESLVIITGVKPNPDLGTQGSADSDYDGTLGTPGPGEIQLRILPMWAVGSEVISTLPDLHEPCFDNMFVVCTRVADENSLSVNSSIDKDYVFADGQRLTRQAFNTLGPAHDVRYKKAHYLTWGFGNKWIDRLEPDDFNGKPNGFTDQIPWTRRWLPPRKFSLKLVEEDILRDVEENPSEPSGGAGEDVIMRRRYTAYKFQVKVDGVTRQFTGSIETINARYVPDFDPVDGGEWFVDDSNNESIAEYLGYDDNSTGVIVKMYAFREAGASSPWDPGEWDSGIDVDGAHLVIGRTGGQQVTQNEFSSVAVLENYKELRYSSNDLPVRALGVSVDFRTNRHVANTRVLAYGQFQFDGIGGFTHLNSSFNFDSVVFVDPGGGTPQNESYLALDWTLNGNPDDNSIVPQVQIIEKSGDFVSLSYFNTQLRVVIQGDNTFRVYCTSDVFGAGNDQQHRILSLTPMHLAITVHGGYD